MIDKAAKNLYKSYVHLCLKNDQPYSSFKHFKKIHEEARTNVLRVHEEKPEEEEGFPICVKQIDENWLYWVEIRKRSGTDLAVVNFITPKQFRLMFHKEINQEEKGARKRNNN